MKLQREVEDVEDSFWRIGKFPEGIALYFAMCLSILSIAYWLTTKILGLLT